eukprot:jgi/Psemu1/309745/fgenesh1_kg.551_\
MLVACFSIAFVLVGYILVKRRRSFRDGRSRERDVAAGNGDPSLAVAAGAGGGYDLEKIDGNDDTNIDVDEDDDDDGDEYDYDGDVDVDEYNYGDLESSNQDHEEESEGQTTVDSEVFEEDEPVSHQRRQQQQQQAAAVQGEYPDLPMSAEAIQMDLGNTLKGQLMGLHGNTSRKLPSCGPLGGNGGPTKQHKRLGSHTKGSSTAYFHQLHDDGDNESHDDDMDSWAQTDGTIGSLELQLEPITAEV